MESHSVTLSRRRYGSTEMAHMTHTRHVSVEFMSSRKLSQDWYRISVEPRYPALMSSGTKCYSTLMAPLPTIFDVDFAPNGCTEPYYCVGEWSRSMVNGQLLNAIGLSSRSAFKFNSKLLELLEVEVQRLRCFILLFLLRIPVYDEYYMRP